MAITKQSTTAHKTAESLAKSKGLRRPASGASGGSKGSPTDRRRLAAQTRSPYPLPQIPGHRDPARADFYEYQFAYYSNTAFDEVQQWITYRKKYGLYRYTRNVVNPMTRVVDFYADHIYPGSLSAQGEVNHDTGGSSAVPLSPTTPTNIRKAVEAIWQMTGWQTKKDVMVTYAAMTGNCLIEINTDAFGIDFNVVFPSMITDFELDSRGDLLSYEIQYYFKNEKTGSYSLFKKSVNAFATYRWVDDIEEPVELHPFPFVPAVWVKHVDIGSDYGVSAFRGSIGKLDEINSMASHTLDHIHRQIRSPRIVWANSQVTTLFKNGAVSDEDFNERSDIMLLKGAQGGNTETLVGNLDPATIVPVLDRLLAELEKDFPELTFYEKLRDQNIVSSPGAKMLMGDVDHRVKRAATNYDLASVRLFAKAMAMGSIMAKISTDEGGWLSSIEKKVLSERRKVFTDLDSSVYFDGGLDVVILPRPLIQETSREEAEQLQLRGQGISSLDGTLPLKERLRWLGYTESEIPAIIAEVDKEQKAAQAVADKQMQMQSDIAAKNKAVVGNSKPKGKSAQASAKKTDASPSTAKSKTKA